MLKFLSDSLLSLLYPEICGVCGRFVESAADGCACRSCWAATRLFSGAEALCVKCGVPLESTGGSNSECKHCSGHEFDAAFAAGVYEKALLASILNLKNVPGVSATGRRRFIEAFERAGLTGEFVVIPVPLSKHRFLERGFNQAAVLTEIIGRHSGLRIDKESLVRRQETPMHRAAMDRKAREATVKNAFHVTRPKLISGRPVLLVDDLMTSGATASQCAAVLKKSGAAKVIVLTLARAA